MDDLERGISLSSVAQTCFSCLDETLLRAKNALSKKRKMSWPIVAVGFAFFIFFCYCVGIQIHAYYIYKAYGLTWFENQLPSIAEVSGKDQLLRVFLNFHVALRRVHYLQSTLSQ